jgi:RHS repeat-associated protein
MHPRFDRGYTGHEHMAGFGLINMNGRLYDPYLQRFLNPDNFVQAPYNAQNFNRYSYVLNNPMMFTDPSGEWIFSILATIIPGAQFLLPLAISTDIGWMTGGMRAIGQGKTFWEGAWRGAVVGAVGGGLSIIGGAGMPFVSNLLLGSGQAAITGGLDAALWGNDIGKGMLWGAITGAVVTTLTSENFTNWRKGEGFYTNKNVFDKMIKRGMDKQAIIDYFGFEGIYYPGLTSKRYQATDFWGATHSETGQIYYGNLAFEDYHTLKGTYFKEAYHSQKIMRGIPLQKLPSDLKGLGMDLYLEEIYGYMHLFRQQGLFPGHNLPMSGVEFYQTQLKWIGVSFPTYPKRFRWIFKIPRRW